MKKAKPLVSAIVSVYNCERFITGCLEDLKAQTLSDQLEIVVVDSGSEENEEAIVKMFQEKYENILYIKTEHRETIYQAWNRGIEISSGRYITNANADDRLRRDAYEVMVKVLEDNTYVDLVYADDLITVVENETYNSATVKTNKDRPEFDLAKLFVNCYIGPHPMWRSSLHDRYGFFNEKYRVAGDYDFWLRLALCCNFKHISEYLGLYLVSTTSAERRRLRVTYAETEEIINKHLQYVVFSRAQMAPIMKKQSQRTYKLGKQYYREALFMAALQALTRSLKYNWKNMDAYKWLCRVFFAGLLLRHRKQRPFGD